MKWENDIFGLFLRIRQMVYSTKVCMMMKEDAYTSMDKDLLISMIHFHVKREALLLCLRRICYR